MRKLIAICLAFAALSFYACSNAEAESNTPPSSESAAVTQVSEKKETLTKDGLQVGDPAPDFNLKNIDGKMYGLKDVKLADGSAPKGYIVTFTCNTCPYAVAYEDRLIALHNDMSQKGYPVIAIQPNDPTMKPGDSYEKMQERAEDKGFPFMYLFDEGQTVFPAYGATRTPEIYLLSSDLKVLYTGAIDDNYQDANAVEIKFVRQAIEAIEAGKDPEPSFTKAIGCSIKAKKS